MKKIIIYPLIMAMLSLALAPVAFGAAPAMYLDEETKGGAMAADILVVRPLGIAATVLGTALFVVAVPFAALGGNVPEAFEHLMAKPAKFTFVRPLGHFNKEQ